MWALLAPLLGPITKKVLDLIPDKNARAKAKELFEHDLMSAVTEASKGQIEINKAEAQHASVFVAGWRPFIGWVCGLGLAWAFIGQPVTYWAVNTFMAEPIVLPNINTDGLYQLVLAMLGMGGLRTFEKIKGVSREMSVLGKKNK
ncbi:MAG: 3TM-type holin [Candidatus Thorarchaeota archaeon]